MTGSNGRRSREATPTCLSDLYRSPTANPLATVVATLVLVTLAYQASVVALSRGPLVGLAVVGVTVLSYRVARGLWAVQNDYVAAALAAGETPPESTADVD